MLKIAFKDGCNEIQYHQIVSCLRKYNNDRDSEEDEIDILLQEGWPKTYHPCDHMENIRWGICFGNSTEKIDDLLFEYDNDPDR